MINLSPLPSDNLYKFLACLGLLLIATSYAYLLRNSVSNREHLINLVSEFEVKAFESEVLRDSVESVRSKLEYSEAIMNEFNEEIGRLIAEYDSTKSPNTLAKIMVLMDSHFETGQFGSVVDELGREIGSLHKSTHINSIELKRLRDLGLSSARHGLVLSVTMLLVNCLGVYLTHFGFSHWWRIQKKEDRLLRKR